MQKDIFFSVLLKNPRIVHYLKAVPKKLYLRSSFSKPNYDKVIRLEEGLEFLGNITEVVIGLISFSDQIFYKIMNVLTKFQTVNRIHFVLLTNNQLKSLYFNYILGIEDSSLVKKIRKSSIFEKLTTNFDPILLSKEEFAEIQSWRSEKTVTWPKLNQVLFCLNRKGMTDLCTYSLIQMLGPISANRNPYFVQYSGSHLENAKRTVQIDSQNDTLLIKELSDGYLLTYPVIELREKLKLALPKEMNEISKSFLVQNLCLSAQVSRYDNKNPITILESCQWYFEDPIADKNFWPCVHKHIKQIDQLYLSNEYLSNFFDELPEKYLGRVNSLMLSLGCHSISLVKSLKIVMTLFPNVNNIFVPNGSSLDINEEISHLNQEMFSKLDSIVLYSFDVESTTIESVDKYLSPQTKKYILIHASYAGMPLMHYIKDEDYLMKLKTFDQLGWEILPLGDIYSTFNGFQP